MFLPAYLCCCFYRRDAAFVFFAFLQTVIKAYANAVDFTSSLWMSIVDERGSYLEASHEFSKLSILATGMRAPRRTPH